MTSFLITTADERTWDSRGPVLLLGEWCRPPSARARWAALDAEVQPYHWDDRERLARDYVYVDRVYERQLAALAEALNTLHACQHSLRFWRIVLGPWLRYFVEILYDRFLSITAAAARPIRDTWILRSDVRDWIPLDMVQFYRRIKSDRWNHRVYAELIQAIGGIPYSIKEPRNVPEDGGRVKGQPPSRISDAGLCVTRCMPARWTRLVFVSAHFNLRDLVRLQCALRQMPTSFTGRCAPEWNGEPHAGRATLALPDPRDEFESVLATCLPNHIPAVHIELFERVREEACRKYVRRPRAIYTASAFSPNEAFKIWAGERVENGARLLIAQHGGHYGMGRLNQGEDHEIAISDRYYTWGWQTPALGDRVKPLPPGKLVGPKVRRLRAKTDGPILLVLIAFARYSNRLYSAPLGPQGRDYVDSQIAFLDALTPEARRHVRIRLDPNPTADGWDTAGRLAEAGFADRIEPQSFLYARLRECRLCVCTHNGTVFLETLSANYPTVVYWNPAHWELRPDAQPYVDALARAGIWHCTPESAAAKVSAIHGDVTAWWSSPSVQSARTHFCGRYAHVTPDWIRDWTRELASL